MGQAGKGLDHTNPSSPGSRKPALGTGGHYPPYSAGPRDPGGPEAGRAGAPARLRQWGPRRGLRLGRRAGRRAGAFARTASAKPVLRRARVYTRTDTGGKARRRQPSVRPRPERTAPSLPQPGAAVPASPRPLTLSCKGHSAPFLSQPHFPISPAGHGVPPRAATAVRWEGQCGGGAGHRVAPSKSSRLGCGGLCSESDSAAGRRARPLWPLWSLWENEGRPLLARKDQGRGTAGGGRGDAGPGRGRGGRAGTRASPGGRHQPASGAGQ